MDWTVPRILNSKKLTSVWDPQQHLHHQSMGEPVLELLWRIAADLVQLGVKKSATHWRVPWPKSHPFFEATIAAPENQKCTKSWYNMDGYGKIRRGFLEVQGPVRSKYFEKRNNTFYCSIWCWLVHRISQNESEESLLSRTIQHRKQPEFLFTTRDSGKSNISPWWSIPHQS